MKEITIKLTAEEIPEIVCALNDRAIKYAKYDSEVYEQSVEMCANLGDKLDRILYPEMPVNEIREAVNEIREAVKKITTFEVEAETAEAETETETVDEYTLNLLTAIEALIIAKEKSPSVNENEVLDEMLSRLTIMYNA